MSSIIPSDINYTTNKVIQFNNKNVPWAINVDEIIHDTNTNNRGRDYSESNSNKLKIISKQNDIDISSANKLNLTASNKIIFNSETSFNNLATFTSIKTNDISCNNIIYSNKINNLNNTLDIFSTSENNIDISSANNLNLTASNKIIFNSESSFNNLAKFSDVSINYLSISNDLLINNQLQINNTILNPNNITLNPITNQLILFNRYKFKLVGNDLKITAINSQGETTAGKVELPSGSTEVTNVGDYSFDKSTITNSVIQSSIIGITDPSIAKFTDVSINNLSISNDLFINELSLNTLKSYEIYLNNNFRMNSDNSINLRVELVNIDKSLNNLNRDISNLDSSMISKFQITDTSVNSLENKLNNFIFDDASFGTVDISKNINLKYLNEHSLLFVDNNKDLSSNNFIYFNETSGIMYFDNSFAMKIPHSIQNTSHDISGLIRYNPDTNNFEGYNGSIWKKFLDTTNNKIDISDNGDISFNKIYFYHETGDISCVNLYNNTLHINNHIIKNDNNFLVIDPQPTGDEIGTLKIRGNLIVDGSQTIIDSTRVDISDINIKLGINALEKSDLNGAGIDISDVATFRYKNDKWNTNIGLNISGDLDVSNINVNNVSFNDLSNIVTQLDNSCIKFNNIPDFPNATDFTNKYLSVSGGVFKWNPVTLEGSIGESITAVNSNITTLSDDVYRKNYIDLSFNDVYNKNYIDLSFNDVYTKEQVKNEININNVSSVFLIDSTTLQISYNKLYSYNEVTIVTNTTISKIKNIASENTGQQFIINIIPNTGVTVTLNAKSNLSKFNDGNTVYINFEDDIICNGSNKESILVTACTPKNNIFIINACLLYEL